MTFRRTLEGEEGGEEGEGGISSGSDVCAGLAMLMLELEREMFEELERLFVTIIPPSNNIEIARLI